ncbi:unnamed protein product [Cylicocyclus nassatus]|uniref:Uncharacterized protein n=1 Tax=Cylicocyclus nassatus TaxID=53992 RepID=A0AA36H9E8_CYLNA|nr:unnamed protein product [Cylicocyclus nassatus]
MREARIFFMLAVILLITMMTCRSMPSKELQYKRMLQEIIGGEDTPYPVFPVAMFPDRLPALQNYW